MWSGRRDSNSRPPDPQVQLGLTRTAAVAVGPGRPPAHSAAFLRENPPPDAEQDRLQRCLNAVEVPWSRRDENQLRLVWVQDFDSPAEKARALLEEIEAIGAEPFHPPDPLPPIDPEEIHLICWLAVQRDEQGPG